MTEETEIAEPSLIIEDKYFDLEADPRFPLTIPEKGWRCFSDRKLNSITCSSSIYLIKANISYSLMAKHVRRKDRKKIYGWTIL